MDQAIRQVQEALAHSQAPAVLSSFGKDSMLLLWLVRQYRPDAPIIWFRTGQEDRFAKQVIRDWDLTAYSWLPSTMYVLANGTERTLVQEYGFGPHRLPVLIDLLPGTTCAADKFAIRTPTLYLPFDTLLVGYKDADQHWLKGDRKLFTNDTYLGNAKVVAPLRHLTDAQVLGAIVDHNIPYEPQEDQLSLCTHCVPAMEPDEFRRRFGLEGDDNG